MGPDDFKARTKAFALHAIKLARTLPRNRETDVIARQLLRSATSVAANYRAACRARSARDFVAKLGIVEEEADESMFWLELLVDAKIVPGDRTSPLLRECNEIAALTVASIRKARRSIRRRR